MKRLNSFYKKYRFNVCLFVLLVFALGVSCVKYLIEDALIVSGDGIVTEVATLSFIKECLINGEYPLWNKYLSAGMTMAGNASMRVFYLPNFILALFPLKYAVYLEYIMHVAVGAMFFFLLLKQIGCRRQIAAAMAFVYLFSINLGGGRKEHMPIIITAIYLPIIVYFIEKYLKTERYKWLIYAAVAMAFQFCGGFMQCILYSDVFVGIYLVVGLLRRGILEKGGRKIKKWCIHFFVWLCTYFGLIAIQLIPLVEFLGENSVYDVSSASYEFFMANSLHPIKLLQMIFPKTFIDVFGAMGGTYSSGMDIELYLGPVVIILLVCGVIIYGKEYRVKAYSIAAIVTFCWACIACFPAVAKIVCKIPLIGNTRVQSRIVFIFCFLILLLVGYIGELLADRKDYQKFWEKAKLIFGALLLFALTAFAGAFVYAIGVHGLEDQAISIVEYFKTSYYKDIILYLLCLLVLLCLGRNEQKRNGRHRFIFLVFLLAINMTGVLPYFLYTNWVSVDVFLDTNNEQDNFLKENIGNYKVCDDYAYTYGSHRSNITQNKSIVKKIAAINSYTNFPNPLIYMMMTGKDHSYLNSSGLLIGGLLSDLTLTTRNDVLSMLGIKYIIDAEGYLDNGTYVYSAGEEKQEILYLEELKDVSVVDNVFSFWTTISLKPETMYKVTFDGSAVANEYMYCDFHGEQYDNIEQDYWFTLTDEKEQYETYVFSGEKVPDQVTFSFICPNASSEILIENVRVTEMDTVVDAAYQLVNSEGTYNIYENVNANDIMYFSNVVNLRSESNIYGSRGRRLDENSYIEGGKELNNTSMNKEITDIDFGINSISASVNVDEDSFVNFSQTYYPGWKVYVDGVRQQVYKVNGVIMGAYIPAGNHVIEFCYKPFSVMAGTIISFMTLAVVVVVGMVDTCTKQKKMQNIIK